MSFVTALWHGSGQACDGFECPCKTTPLSTSIYTAAQLGDLVTVQQRILRNPALVNQCDDFGYTPLHYAAQNGFAPVAAYLLAVGASANAGTCGASALHRTVALGRLECCELLLKAGALVNVQDSSFGDLNTPAHKAVLGGHAHLLPLLQSFGADFSIRNALGESVHDLLAQMGVGAGTTGTGRGAATASTEAVILCVPAEGVPARPASLSCARCQQPSFAFARDLQGRLVCSKCRRR